MTWQNRIVGHDNVPPDQLLAHPDNWRVHPRYQQEALRGVINDIGYIKSVTVNKLTGRVVDGHLRVTLALRDGIPTIPVEYVELTEAEEAEALLTLDPIAALAGADKNNLETLLKQVNTGDAAVMELLKDTADKAGLDWGNEEPKDAEPQIDRAAELLEKWQVQTGDLWQIGEHRLLCGDSTKREDVERVNDGEYDMIADPPYNVGFNYASITDDKDAQAWKEFCDAWFSVCSKDARGAIVTPGPRNERLYPEPRDKGIWAKKNATAGASCFHLRVCEPILFYGKFEKKRNTDLFEYSSGFSEELTRARLGAGVAEQHPPAKSMPLWLELIGMLGDVVFDPFGGNGTTLLACENLHKKGRMIELYPAYCAVILERMAQAFPALEIKRINQA